jgi:serine/threonine protein kinase
MLKNTFILILTLQALAASDCLPYETLSEFSTAQIKAYKTSDIVGMGTFGTGYKFTWRTEAEPKVDVPAIIKVQRENDYEIGSIFESEADILTQIHTGTKVEHVPRLFGCYNRFDDRHYLIVERVEYALAPRVFDFKRNKYIDNPKYIELMMLPSKERLLFFAQMADGLDEIHAKTFIHGDVKPENMMMNINGNQWKVFFIDFGAAVKKGHCSTTASRIYIDHDYFTSCLKYPELLRNTVESPNSEKQDIFALAVTIYHLENRFDRKEKGIKQFEKVFEMDGLSEKDITLIAKRVADEKWIKDSNLNFISDLNNKHSTFADLMKQMVHEDRTQRPSAAEVAALLREFAKGKSDWFGRKAWRAVNTLIDGKNLI